MLKSILSRNRRAKPYNPVEIEIIRAATKNFLQLGYSNTTMKMVAKEANTGLGNITYYFHSKDDLLLLFIEELMDYHSDIIENALEDTGDALLAYSTEIAAQIGLCENDERARDIYHNAYACPGIMSFIREWGSKKSFALFRDRLTDWTAQDFYNRESISAFIEFSAIDTPCDSAYTLENKVALVLDSLLSLYQVSADERKTVIDKILKLDYTKIGTDTFKQFIDRFEKSAEEFNK